MVCSSVNNSHEEGSLLPCRSYWERRSLGCMVAVLQSNLINWFIPFNMCPFTVNCHRCGGGVGTRLVLIAYLSCLYIMGQFA